MDFKFCPHDGKAFVMLYPGNDPENGAARPGCPLCGTSSGDIRDALEAVGSDGYWMAVHRAIKLAQEVAEEDATEIVPALIEQLAEEPFEMWNQAQAEYEQEEAED